MVLCFVAFRCVCVGVVVVSLGWCACAVLLGVFFVLGCVFVLFGVLCGLFSYVLYCVVFCGLLSFV